MSKKKTGSKIKLSTITISNSNLIQRPKRHFNYENGDEYEGEYGINLSTKSIFRHGHGVYTTISCVRFEGDWVRDKLVGFVRIEYKNGHWFEGNVDETGAVMTGTLFAVDGSKLVGEFSKKVENDVVTYGQLDFIDRNERYWDVSINNDVILLTRERFL